MNATAILQRTSLGLETIKTKSVRLTQSERLILIVVDGVTPYAALRDKVWALSMERFVRALNTLLAKDLIFEVLLPDEAQQPETLDSAVVDHFLQQDTLDPVTIISVDPEDHFGMDLIAEMGHVLPSPAIEPAVKTQPLPAPVTFIAAPPLSSDTSDGKSLPASDLQLNPDLIKAAQAVLPLRENNPPSGIQAPAAVVRVAAAHPAIRKVSIHSASRMRSHDYLDELSGDEPKNQSVDILKLCSWTGLISGLGIFMFLLFQYYYRAIA
ncbi:MAG: hypothetical protein A3I66_10645 [Burkholderiales bacterium RIFCSPLOWO2_02_FULL_57_36]|nr:MAG: hypothetical protein A3I66_10645 [Burkholderiales bacterium RIFCSPLOWO2_02_FULL_57_36]